ncbi:MAG: efflux RND transporter periplasmic adaptor subunit, partial [Gemmatimonadaceae bacterium]|nr:efflux RND transporter periplasmic adaptor subunit [Gloeobacterales cyanobacterium ES-bin-141]
LREQGAVSEQDTEERRSAYDVRAAEVAAREASLTASTANIRRLSALQDFRNVTAPFAGVITERNTDTGALITAGNTTPGLFRIASTDTLRIFVNVPQNFVRAIKPGQVARVEVQEYPGRVFTGRVARTAGALDASARTLRTEVRLPNSDGALLAGMYAQVKFTLPSGGPTLLIPASTLVIAGRGPQVAVLEDNRVRFRSIRLGRDLGEEVEVTGGLRGNEQLVSNPSDAVREGTVVEPARKKS